MSLYSTLKFTYFPVPLPVSPFVKCMSTSGFLTVIVVPSFETSVGAFSIVGVSSAALVVASVAAGVSVAGAAVAGVSVAGAAVSVVGAAVAAGATVLVAG